MSGWNTLDLDGDSPKTDDFMEDQFDIEEDENEVDDLNDEYLEDDSFQEEDKEGEGDDDELDIEEEEEDDDEDDEEEDSSKEEDEEDEATTPRKNRKTQKKSGGAQDRIRHLVKEREDAKREKIEAQREARRAKRDATASQVNVYEQNLDLMNSSIKNLESSREKALEEGDSAMFVKLDAQYQEMVLNRKAVDSFVKTKKKELEQMDSENEAFDKEWETASKAPTASGVDVGKARSLADNWMVDNPWFYKDEAKRNYSIQLSKQLEAEGELSMDSEEFYEELNARIEEKYEGKVRKAKDDPEDVVDEEEPAPKRKKKKTTAAGGSMKATSPKTKRKIKVSLSKQEEENYRLMGFDRKRALQIKAKAKLDEERRKKSGVRYTELDLD
jgi:hypothetical protein